MILDNKFVYQAYCRWVLHNPRLRVFLTALLVPNKEEEVRLFGSSLTINSRSEIGLWRANDAAQRNAIFRDEIGPLVTLALLLQPGDSFVDIGANVGLYSSVLSRYVNLAPNVRFYAFEPNPDTVTRLRSSLSHANVQVFNVALSDREQSLTFIEGSTSGVFAEVSAASAFSLKGHECELIAKRLDDFDIEGNSIILKIDVEGHERAVLDGCSSLFEAQRIKAVFLDGYEDASIPVELRARGFELFNAENMAPVGDIQPRQLLAVASRFITTHRSNDAQQLTSSS